MPFQKTPRLDRDISHRSKYEQGVNDDPVFVPHVPLIDADFDAIVDAARIECAEFMSGLNVPGFARSGARHG